MNVKSRLSRSLGVAAAALALSLGALAAPASADPDPLVDYRQLAGVGADTTQDVMNALGNEITNSSGKVIASWNATGFSVIKTKPTGCEFARPDGSGAGITALKDAVGGGTGCVDFARSTRGPVDLSRPDLTFVPFAEDALSWAKRSDSPLPDNLTILQLHDIYSCTLTSLNGVPLTPILPLSVPEELRFLTFIGVRTPGPCVTTGRQIQENNGWELLGAGDIMPYSAAQYLEQIFGIVDDRHGEAVLGRIEGVEPWTQDYTLNAAFPFVHDVYNVVPTARLFDPGYVETFVGQASYVCANTRMIRDFAFLPISNCGRIDIRGEL
ncbi:hypothetical protein [Streptomyces sp. NPDC048282]|uniref:hypothetical protein n=1 Tax=Streptomyces sp. NPDC048282 TaxID=3365528 RepID=UPI0037200400